MDSALVARAARRFARTDPLLARLARAVGPLPARPPRSDFEHVCRIIAGQQLSTRAAQAIWTRVRALVEEFSPAAVAALPVESLRACGLSGAKARFIRGAAARIAAGEVDLAAIRALDDAAATAALRGFAGFGPWSTEMYLISALERPDVFSTGDGGLRRAVAMLYGERALAPKRLATLSDAWRPYRSVASRVLWAWLDAGAPDPGGPPGPGGRRTPAAARRAR